MSLRSTTTPFQRALSPFTMLSHSSFGFKVKEPHGSYARPLGAAPKIGLEMKN